MNEITRKGQKLMTLREVAEQIGCTYRTVANYAQKAGWSQHGVTTYLNEEQVTLILEAMKQSGGQGRSATVQVNLQGLSTHLSTDAQIALKTAEIERVHNEMEALLRKKNEELAQKNEELQIELDKSKEWASIKRIESITGGKYRYKLLRDESRRLGIPMKDTFDSNYGTVKAYHMDVWYNCYQIDIEELI